MAATTERSINYGLLIMRVGIGILFLKYGIDKINAGPEKWQQLGEAMKMFGIGFAPTFWGGLAAFAETVGGICLLFGVLFRPGAILLLITMVVASLWTFQDGGLQAAGHAIAMMVVALGFLVSGPGRIALGNTVSFLRDKWYQ